jgi:hypothetical protein
MNENYLLGTGIVVFLMLVVGLYLTISEFNRME